MPVRSISPWSCPAFRWRPFQIISWSLQRCIFLFKEHFILFCLLFQNIRPACSFRKSFHPSRSHDLERGLSVPKRSHIPLTSPALLPNPMRFGLRVARHLSGIPRDCRVAPHPANTHTVTVHAVLLSGHNDGSVWPREPNSHHALPSLRGPLPQQPQRCLYPPLPPSFNLPVPPGVMRPLMV